MRSDKRTSFVCTYPTWTDSDGVHQTSGEFTLTFLIDHETSNAYMIGNLGSTKVTLTGSDDEKLTLIEVTPAGNVMITTIDGNLNSVHSRHTVTFGELLPSQYHGACEIRE